MTSNRPGYVRAGGGSRSPSAWAVEEEAAAGLERRSPAPDAGRRPRRSTSAARAACDASPGFAFFGRPRFRFAAGSSTLTRAVPAPGTNSTPCASRRSCFPAVTKNRLTNSGPSRSSASSSASVCGVSGEFCPSSHALSDEARLPSLPSRSSRRRANFALDRFSASRASLIARPMTFEYVICTLIDCPR